MTTPTRIALAIVVLAALAALITACNSNEPTQTPTSNEGQWPSAPTVTVELPTPTPRPAPTSTLSLTSTPTPSAAPTPTPSLTPTPTPSPAPTPTEVPVLPPPTATSSPTATPNPSTPTPAPTPIVDERRQEIEAQLPTPRLNHQTFTLNDGRILFAGGQLPIVVNNGVILSRPHPYLEVYDPESDEWSLADLVEPPLTFLTTAQLDNGDVLIQGLEVAADQADFPPSASYILDQETLALTRVSRPAGLLVLPDMVLMDDGRVAAVGGIDLMSEESFYNTPASLAVEIYDSTSDRWARAAPQIEGLERSYNSWEQDNTTQWVFPLPGARLLTLRVGGILRGDGLSSDDAGRIEIYDSATDTWESLATTYLEYDGLPWHAVLSPSGVLYMMYQDRIEAFNPSTGEWSISYPPDSVILEVPEDEEPLSFERHALPVTASVTELPDGRFLVAGGERSRYSALPRAATVLYDPDTRIWALGPELADPRLQHSATVLDDGSVLLFGGATLWEENESEVVPTDAMEIIPAAVLAAVDTVTPRTTLAGTPLAPSGYPCWNMASSVPAPLPVVTNAGGELPDARQLLADSLDAMNAAESYALTYQELRYDGEPELDTLDTLSINNSICSSGSYTFEAPNRLIIEGFSFQNRLLNGGAVSVVIADQSQYFYWHGVDSWGDYDAPDETFQLIDEVFLRQETLEDSAITWTVGAIEELDGKDVYHVRGKKTETESDDRSVASYDFWIGTEDYLVRRMYGHDNSPQYFDPDRREQTYTLLEAGRFGQEFNIQLPPEPEIVE